MAIPPTSIKNEKKKITLKIAAREVPGSIPSIPSSKSSNLVV